MIDLPELERRLRKPRPGRAILFTGAGFSDGATNTLNEKIPLARKFASALATTIGENPELPLTLISELYNEKQGNDRALLTLLQTTFTAKEVPDAQRRILAYPWKRIYTTNYDDVAEHVLGPDGARPDSFSRKTLPIVLEGGRRQIVHINGYVREINRESVVDDFALTLSSYLDKSLFSSDWATTVRQDFELSDLIIFAGYSLYDTDISNILGKNPAFRQKTVAIQYPGLPNVDEKFLSRFGAVHKIGNDGFAQLVDSVLKNGEPKVSVEGPENFYEIILPPDPPALAVTDSSMEALLGRGIYNRNLFISSRIHKKREYLAERTDAKKIAEALSTKGRHIVCHSEMGNGKTLAVEHVIFELLTMNVRTFQFHRKTDNFAFDIEFFSSLKENYALIVEEMIANEDAIEALTSQLTNASILTSARSSAFEVKFSEIKNLFSADVKVIDTNKLGDADIDSLIRILNAGAYWTAFPDARTNKAKRKIIETKCRREMSSVLLGVVESQVFDNRIRESFQGNVKDKAAQKAIVLALCLNVVEMRPTFELLSELLGKDIFSAMDAFDNEYVRRFFAISGIEILARSPIMSLYIVKHFVSDDDLIETIIEALRASSARFRKAKRYVEINRKFLQFSFVEKIISSTNNKYARVQDFYDRAGDIGYKEFSPHFWLQYAIAARAFKDFKVAERYFEASRKIISRRPDFYTYQIDNNYAQFLLESRMETDIWSDFFDAFVQASTLSMQQTYIKKAGIYPYKVASAFSRYIETRSGQFSKRQKADAMDVCKSWVSRIDGCPETLRRNLLVKRARVAATDAIELLEV